MKPGFGITRVQAEGTSPMSSLTDALARVEEQERAERPRPAAPAALPAALTAVAAAIDPNLHLARSAAARSATQLALAQCGLVHPTLKSEWTFGEILRLLDALYEDPSGEITLGGQHLGKGFAPAPSPASDPAVLPGPFTRD